MAYFNVGEVRKKLETIFNEVQKWEISRRKTDANWLCSMLLESLSESGRALRENERLRKEIKALRKKENNNGKAKTG